MKRYQPKGLDSLRVLFFLLSAVPFCSGFTTKGQLVKKGNEAFKDKRYKTALENYEKAQVKNPDSPVIRYNAGNAYYELSEYRDAERAYEKVLPQSEQDKPFLAKALYNYGNVQYRLGQFDKAIEAYKKVLDLNPQDSDAKYNLELITAQKKAFDKRNSERKKQQKDQQKQRNQSPSNQKQESGGKEKQEKNQGGGGQSQDQKSEQGEGKQSQSAKAQEQQKSEDKSEKEGKSGTEQAAGLKEKNEQGQEEEKKKEVQKGQEGEEKEKQQPFQGQELSPYELSQLETQPLSPEPAGPRDKEQPQQEKGNVPIAGGYHEGTRISPQQAFQILNALYESEREALNLRKPPAKSREKTTDKDW